MVPTLETERLILRGYRPDDLDDVAAMWADPDVTRHITGAPSSREDSWGRILRYAGHWALMGFGYWLLEEKVSGRYAGDAGFGDFKRGVSPEFAGRPEHGWSLAPWARGRGYATEALRAQLDWAANHFDADAVVCMISVENAPSLKLAERVGYASFGRAAYRDADNLLLRRPLR